jgi:competence protein ComFC
MNWTVAQSVTTIYHLALDAIFPSRCAGCGTWSETVFCPACRALLHPIVAPMCDCCGYPFDPLAHSAALCAECRPNRYHAAPPFEALRSVYTFEGPLRHAMHRFKYADKRALAEPLAALLHDFLRKQRSSQSPSIPSLPCDRLALITPVPLHSWRHYRRGYNQSELLARALGDALEVPVGTVLRRIRHTVPQVELVAKRRAENVSGAFSVDAGALRTLNPRNGPVLVLDDVCTTGSTLRECARVLKAAGAPEVYALTLARQL